MYRALDRDDGLSQLCDQFAPGPRLVSPRRSPIISHKTRPTTLSNRNSLSNRIASKSLKIKDRHQFYPKLLSGAASLVPSSPYIRLSCCTSAAKIVDLTASLARPKMISEGEGIREMDEKALRDYLRRSLGWHEAHVDWKGALKDFPEKDRGTRPKGCPHSGWELLEHMRIATEDIFEFSRDAKHASPDWPVGYWPTSPAPPSTAAWDKSVKELERNLEEMGKFVENPKTDLFAKIPHGSGQTVLREAMLIADHNAYHIGQIVLVRRLLGCWPET